MKKLLTLAAAVLTMMALSSAPVHAAPKTGETTMLLSVWTMNDGTGEPGSEVSTKLAAWYLSCFPAKGTHPDYKHACKVLTGVDGWVDAITRDKRACTKEYNPVTLRIEGSWKGRDLYWSNYYGNRCEAAAATRNVYPA